MSAEIVGLFILAGAVGTFIHKFDKQMKELGISKTDLKIIFSGLVLYILYRHYNKIMVKTKALMGKRRHLLQVELNR